MQFLRDTVKSLLPPAGIRFLERENQKETHINRALGKARRPATYLEIGVRDGACIAQIQAETRIAVDPAPVDPAGPAWSGVRLHARTSDDYFRSLAPVELRGHRVDVALVDGMHEFRQTLRDVLNLEGYMSAAGTIFIHDCNPPTRAHAENMNGAWNGDVWKVVHYLRRHRPDLDCFTLDCDWGLGVVSGFGGHAPPVDASEVDRIAALDYRVLEKDRKSILRLKSPLVNRIF